MRDSIRVAILCYRGNMLCGGQGVYLWNLSRALNQLGHTVEVWTGPPYPHTLPTQVQVNRVIGHEFWSKWFVGDPLNFLPQNPYESFTPLSFYELASSRLGFLPEPALFSLRVFKQISARCADFDIVHDVQSLGWGLLGIRRLGLPVVSTIHHPLSIDRRAAFRTDRTLRDLIGTVKFFPIGMQAFVARRLDHILTSSTSGKKALATDFGVKSTQMSNVSNGVDTNIFTPGTDRRHSNQILCVARARDPNKGVADLIRAMRFLPKSSQLLLIDSPDKSNPARLWAKDAGCLDRLEIRGNLSTRELVTAYQRATVVAVPSHYEGFGLPAVEAMACGAPVVITSGGALPEIAGEVAASIVPSGRPEVLAKALRDLIEGDSAKRLAFGQAGTTSAKNRFSWTAIAEKTVNIYRQVIEERRGLPVTTKTSAN